ncbi:MAG: hypothetical protein ACKVQS_12430 [Fimbriimonadaceae bacterium]
MTESTSNQVLMEWSVAVSPELQAKRIPVLIALVVSVFFGHYLIGWIGAVVGGLAIFASTAEIWLPAKFKITELDASSRIGLSQSVIRWENVVRLIDTENGVRLSPLAKSSRLDAFRGVYLRFSGNRDAVLGKIAELAKINGSSVDGEADA